MNILNEINCVKVEDLEKIILERKVVGLLHRSKQNGHYWAFQLPFMNLVQVPSDLADYKEIRITGYDDLELYVSKN